MPRPRQTCPCRLAGGEACPRVRVPRAATQRCMCDHHHVGVGSAPCVGAKAAASSLQQQPAMVRSRDGWRGGCGNSGQWVGRLRRGLRGRYSRRFVRARFVAVRRPVWVLGVEGRCCTTLRRHGKTCVRLFVFVAMTRNAVWCVVCGVSVRGKLCAFAAAAFQAFPP